MDIWGPYSTATLHGHKYFLTIVDDFSRFTWLVLLKGKREVASHIQHFIHLLSMHPKELFIRQAVFKLPNRMGEWKGNINVS
jgi:hypothetical protein